MGAQVPLRARRPWKSATCVSQAPLLEVGHVGPSGAPGAAAAEGPSGAAGSGVAGDGVQLALVVDALGEAPLPQQPGAVQAPVQGGLVEVELAHPGHAVGAVAQGLGRWAAGGGSRRRCRGRRSGRTPGRKRGRRGTGRRGEGQTARVKRTPARDLRQVGHTQGEGRQPRGLPGHPIRAVLIREEEEDVRPLDRGRASGLVWGACGCSHEKDRRSIEVCRRWCPTSASGPAGRSEAGRHALERGTGPPGRGQPGRPGGGSWGARCRCSGSTDLPNWLLGLLTVLLFAGLAAPGWSPPGRWSGAPSAPRRATTTWSATTWARSASSTA